jgi:hypothetical protein
MLSNSQLLQDNFPFLTVISYLKQEYVGIVQNADATFLNLYVMSQNFSDDQKKEFLDCGETWWWSSNRTIPINIFLGKRFEPFKPSLKVFVRKECEILQGPIVDINNLLNKRIKRRTISLVKKTD